MAATVDCDTDPCSIHFEKYQFYCCTCQRLMCCVCLSSGAHKEHDFTEVDDSFYDRFKTNIQQLVDDIRQVEVAIEESLLATEEQDKITNEWFLSVRSDIKDFFLQSVSKVVDGKEKDLQDSLKSETNRHTRQLQHIKEDCDAAAKSCQESRQFVNEHSLLSRLRKGRNSSVAESVRVVDEITHVNERVEGLLSSPRPSKAQLKFVDMDLNADQVSVEFEIDKLGGFIPQSSITDLQPTELLATQLSTTQSAIPEAPNYEIYSIPGPAVARDRSSSEREKFSHLSNTKGIIQLPDKVFPYLSDEGSSLQPFGVCCAWNNGIAVSSTTATCLHVYSVNGELLKTVRRKFNKCMNLAYYSTKHKLVCIDHDGNGKCQLVKIKGGILQEKRPYELSELATGSPGGVTMEIDERKAPALFITDSVNSVIYRFGTQGKTLQCLVDEGGVLAKPMGIAYTQGCVVVCNHDNNSIIKLNTTDWSTKWKADLLSKPFGVAADAQGYIYVTESEKHRVSIFSSTGKFVAYFGRKGHNPGMFDTPQGITITEDNTKLVVADSRNGRLQVFSRSLILNNT